MIGKVLRGTNASGLLRYLYGPGRANEHTDTHLVAGFSDPAELEPGRSPGGSPDLRRLAGLLAQPVAALACQGCDKPVWHCSVRAAPEDRVLSDVEWAQVAAGIMDRTGLAPQGDDLGVRWVAVRHAPDHIHIVATLARQDGGKPSTWNDFYRVREACQDAERRFGLRPTAPADRTAARRATRAETEQAARRGWSETPRAALRREVCTAAAGAGTEQEFFARLRQAGVLVRLRRSMASPGQVTGYAVGLARHTARDGGVIWYGGGKLAADLTSAQAAGPLAAASRTRPPLHSGTASFRGPRRAPEQANHGGAGAGRGGVLRPAAGGWGAGAGAVQPRLIRARSPGTPSRSPATPAPTGRPRWYGGGRLAVGLTLPQLRRRWLQAPSRAPKRGAAFRFTAPERDTIYQHASRQAAQAAEHIRRCAYSDPAAAADAAWAAADTLHVAARALRSPVLRCAADAYDRAARAGHGRIPHRSHDGDRLRATARLLAQPGRTDEATSPVPERHYTGAGPSSPPPDHSASHTRPAGPADGPVGMPFNRKRATPNKRPPAA